MSLNQNFQLQDTSSDFQFNEEEFKKNLPDMTNHKLCEIIVCYRYLGLMEKESILSMEELAARRERGDQFNYEDKITELTNDLPSINIDINKILKTFRI
jgi:hypothetical protein